MVSRRNYFTITLIMLVVFCMFQVPEIVKERVNHYEQNEYVSKTTTRFQKDSVAHTSREKALESDLYVVYIGDGLDGQVGSIVTQWCGYTKRFMSTYRSLAECSFDKGYLPETVFIDSAYMNIETDVKIFKELTEQGVDIVFCNLPEPDKMAQDAYRKLWNLLGIRYIRSKHITVEGIRLLDGFLLGGVKEYQLDDTMKKTQQDLNLDVPWYGVSSRTKVYMSGMIDQNGENVDEADKMLEGATYVAHLPALIWRSNIKGADIFVVNGDYINNQIGLGILSAMMTETKDYDLYPVVNAQNFVVVNFPDLASENEETMMQMYSQNLKAVYRDIVWPGLVSVAQQNDLKMTCMFMPQKDYTDHVDPEDEMLIYYMKRIQEQGAEAGLSGTYEGIGLEEKTKQDVAFIRGVLPDYTILSFYPGNLSADGLETVFEKNEMLRQLHSIYRDYDDTEPLLSYYSANVISQRATNDGYSHTFSENFRMNSIETALGYTSISVDVNPVGFPNGVEDSWEKLSEKFASNTSTYWKKYKVFTQTTLAQSDLRIRRFLALTYRESRVRNRIMLDVDNFDTEAYFILRTHGEEVESVDGGSYEKIEKNAYLISLEESSAQISLREAEDLYYSYEAEE